jgi:hypothetical protein
MTKLLNVLVVVAILTIGVFALPAMAQNVFDVRIIECGDGAFDDCGSNPPLNEPGGFFANRGFVRVNISGLVSVRLTGAAANTTYCVFVGNWVDGGGFQPRHPGNGGACDGAIGTITTNASGVFGVAPIDANCSAAGMPTFSFDDGTRIGQPSFAFNPSGPGGSCPGSATHYTTGFFIP